MAINEQYLKQFLNESKEEKGIDILSNSLPENPDNPVKKSIAQIESINRIVATQKHLAEVKNYIGDILDTLDNDPSLITRASSVWGELPTWQKYAGVVVLAGPMLAIGLFAQIPAFLAFGSATAVTYAGGGYVLDDHYRSTAKNVSNLKQGLFSLADMMNIVIEALDKIRQDLAIEIEKFTQENLRLTTNVDNLSEEVDILTNNIEACVNVEQLLREDQKKLEATRQELELNVAENKELLDKTYQELEVVKKDYAKSQARLGESVSELAVVRGQLDLEVEKVKDVTYVLQGTVNTLADVVIGGDKREESMKLLLANTSHSFDTVTERLRQTESSIVDAHKGLENISAFHKEISEQYESRVKRLENLSLLLDKHEGRVETKGLHTHGFYSVKNPEPIVPSQQAPLTIQ